MPRLALQLCLLLALWSSPVAAQQAESAGDRARRVYDQGMKLYLAGQYRQAIRKFEAARAIKEHENHLYHLSRCYQKLGRLRTAYEYSREYILRLPVDKRPRTLRQAEKRLRWDPPCQVSISSVPASASVFVDGKLLGETPEGRSLVLSLPGGRPKVELRLAGYKTGLWAPTLQFGEPRSRAFHLPGLRATLRVKSNVSGTRISLMRRGDGEGGQSPVAAGTSTKMGVAPLWRELRAGRHLVQAEAAGYMPKREWVVLAPGETRDILFEFLPGDRLPPALRPMAAPSSTNTLFFDVAMGPALTEYGGTVAPAGWSVELGASGGYIWRLGSWGLYARGSVHYSPAKDLADGASSGAYVMGLAGGGGRYYIRPWLWLDGGAFLGLSVLVGASAESMLFVRSNTDPNLKAGEEYEFPTGHDGAGYESLALRGRIGLGFAVGAGITVAVYPAAMDYCTRNTHFHPSVTGILRYNAAVAVGWQR